MVWSPKFNKNLDETQKTPPPPPTTHSNACKGEVFEGKKDTIFYLCDRQKCKKCNDFCGYTKDIDHAKNFHRESGIGSTYFENAQCLLESTSEFIEVHVGGNPILLNKSHIKKVGFTGASVVILVSEGGTYYPDETYDEIKTLLEGGIQYGKNHY